MAPMTAPWERRAFDKALPFAPGDDRRQVDDANRSPESRRTWRPFFNQTNAHNDVFDATCLRGQGK